MIHQAGDDASMTRPAISRPVGRPQPLAPNNIGKLRAAAGLTQPDLAEKVGTTPQTISRLERGQRKLTVEWMNQIAPALNVMPSALLVAVPTKSDTPPILGEPIKTGDEVAVIRLWRLIPREIKDQFVALLEVISKLGPPGP